jgi:hypothetical protein
MASPSKPRPMFDSPSKHGVHPAISAFTPTERRFQWQESSSATDALYALPTYIGTGPKKSFGSSTREDWDLSRKSTNDCAGPGSYKAVSSCGTRQPSSLCRNSSVTAFENAPRSPLRSDATPSPGPVYEIATSIGTSPTAKIGTSKRPPLSGKTEGPGPNLLLKSSFPTAQQGVSPTFGTEPRGGGATRARGAPGPIYDLTPTGFQTGSVISFSKAKRF